uniref:Uncharacterized protein n=1 Tax=Anguilla anguilla TaxID=7936 RepID=A0A0E9PRL7_ANGAN
MQAVMKRRESCASDRRCADCLQIHLDGIVVTQT